MLVLDCIAGQGLGPFTLGLSVQDAVLIIKQHSTEYQCVEVKVSEDEEFEFVFLDHGFKLVFEGHCQRCRRIEITDGSRLRLRCGTASPSLFGGAANPPTYTSLSEAFGPTYELDIDEETGMKPLLYPGFLALFEPAASALGGQASVVETNGALSDISNSPTGPAVRICIFPGTFHSVGAALRAPLPAVLVPFPPTAEVVPGEGAWFPARNCTVRLTDSAQDVVTELGEPDDVFHKPSFDKGEGVASDYYFNYFALGLDVMLSGDTHRVHKLIFHTNPVLHHDFGLYKKCNFRLHVGTGFSLPAYAVDCQADEGEEAEGVGAGEEALVETKVTPAHLLGEADTRHSLSQADAHGMALATSDNDRGQIKHRPSKLTTACHMLAELMDGAFVASSDSESPQTEDSEPGFLHLKERNKATLRRTKSSQLAQDGRSDGGGTDRGGGGSPKIFSPGTSPATSAIHHVPYGRPPRPPSIGALGSTSSSAADLTRHERRCEIDGHYRDGWSDGEDLARLVISEGEGKNGETACSVGVQTQCGDDDEAYGGALESRDGSGGATADDIPESFVYVDEAEESFDKNGSDEFDTLPRMRTCSTQTARVPRTDIPNRNAAAAAAAADRLDGLGGACAVEGHFVSADSGIDGIKAAFGKLGKGAINPHQLGSALGRTPNFPPTRLFGYPGVVFEVLANGTIASLTLFS